MKKILIISMLGLMAFLCFAQKKQEAKPNIIFILADDLSYNDLSCFGQNKFKTPNIDRIAQEGIVFTKSYSAQGECAPSRCGLLTGMHMGHATVRSNVSVRGEEYLNDSDFTIAEMLNESNYATAFIGKWGVGLPGSEGEPIKQGFDYSFGFYDQRQAHTYYPTYLYENGNKIDIPENKGYDIKKMYDYNSRSINKLDDFKNRYDAILIKNITVWTNEAEGILKNKDVYITEGRIVRIADEINATKLAFAKIIDGEGKHLTAGIIDEHSHIAISNGVNEATQASSAEVRIEDVINSEDINIYRQLAGGVTTAQLLHGSANPIGGQSAIIKLRWGKAPEEMKFAKADGFIKFALGENVKQSNWGEYYTTRFPQSRMGVEQVYYDYFTRAKEYILKQKSFIALSEKEKAYTIPYRKDLEMEALAEILNNKRFITCHSYVQSEINMLMHVADSMGFKINTFTHILEGYKVADKMKLHGAGASTFSDWWAYKIEVQDAIPYNASLLNQMGIITAINSDDAEMGRRLNQEAAKSIKYGKMSEEDALKLITLNPAKLLHIDSKVGSIKVGKDADLVVWSDNPLSIYAKVEKTIIDGLIYFDKEEDLILRKDIQKERSRIIQKMLSDKKGGALTQKIHNKIKKLDGCESIELDYLKE